MLRPANRAYLYHLATMSKRKSSQKSSGAAEPTANRAHNDNHLTGMEDIAHGETDGVPFILVDGMDITTRRDLEVALTKCEQQRICQLELVSQHLPRLEQTQIDLDGAAAAAAAIASLKAVEDELKFQADLQQLSLHLHEKEHTQQTLYQTSSNLEQIRCKLEQLRQKQQQSLQSPSLPVEAEATERPSIKREGTFDIKKEDGYLKGCHVESLECQAHTHEIPEIINEIGKLLMQFQLRQEQEPVAYRQASYSYLVTITPKDGTPNCSVHPWSTPRVNSQETKLNQSLVPHSRHSAITIFAPNTKNGLRTPFFQGSYRNNPWESVGHNVTASSGVLDTVATAATDPAKPQKSRTFLKMPTATRDLYGYAQKRD